MRAPGKEYVRDCFLTAGECNPQRQIPPALLAERLIETATFHANRLGVGYSELAKRRMAWVLVRMTLEMERYPGLNENYSIRTWIESCNRLISERCFEITDFSGKVVGAARTSWTAIETATRKPADLSTIPSLFEAVSGRECPVAARGKIPAVTGEAATVGHDFKYCDFDFNGHVNFAGYIESILGLWPAEHHNDFDIRRFEISYLREIRSGGRVLIRTRSRGTAAEVEMASPSGVVHCRARITFVRRDA